MSGTERSALLVALEAARRRTIAEALERRGVSVVGELTGPEGALPMLERYGPDVLVVELAPASGGSDPTAGNEQVLELVRAARELVPDLRVIAVADSLDAVVEGVDAYLLGSDAE